MDGMKCIGSLTTCFSNHLLAKINTVTMVASTQSLDGGTIAATELDSHADSPVVGHNAVILESLNNRFRSLASAQRLGSQYGSR